MSVVKADPVFTITTPSVSVTLADNRIGEVPFTVTNVGNRKLRARARISPANAPAEWFLVAGDSEQDFEIGAARQFVVRVDPPLGAPAGTYAFRLDAIGIENPDDDYSEGPSCQVTIPESQRPKLMTPRGYLTTLVGALTGGIVLDVIVVIMALTHETDTSCDGGFWECLFTVVIREIVFWFFLVLLGFGLMLVGASFGSAIALRIRRFRGHKLTGTFLALLMLPWTVLMALTVFQLLKDHPIVLAATSPLVLLAVPAVLARGSVLLIRTRHI